MNMAVYHIGDFVDFLPLEEPPATPVKPAFWYLLRVHPNLEFRVMDGFARHGISAHLSTFPQQQKIHDQFGLGRVRTRTVTRPLFPGLIFVPDFEADLERLKLIDGVVAFLQLRRPEHDRDDVVAKLSTALFDDVRRLEAFLAVPRSKRAAMFAKGDLVRINEGHFEGWTARFDGLEDGGRIRVLIDAMKRGLAVKIAESQVEPV